MACAAAAGARGIGVTACTNPAGHNHPLVLQDLRRSGTKVRFRRYAVHSRIHGALCAISSCYMPALDDAPEVILISLAAFSDLWAWGRCGERFLDVLHKRSVPYVLLVHAVVDGWIPGEAGRLQAVRILEGAASVAFVSEASRRLAERQIAAPIPRHRVLRNPVNVRAAKAASWPITGRAQFASVARLDCASKGQDLLLEALASDRWRQRDLDLNLYGAGPDRSYLKALTSHFGLSDRVHFHGHVKDIDRVWAENHLAVFPSRFEGLPLAMVEAMLSGRPCVATAVGGIEELLDETRGVLTRDVSVAGISDALDRAWLRKAEWAEMGANAREAALKFVDPDPGLRLLELLAHASGRTVPPIGA